MGRKRRLHYKDLDVLRFLAFVPIFIYCALYLLSQDDNPFITDAAVAFGFIKQNSLDFFFFLSSFLLTAHALREYKYNQGFALKAYLIRRMIRILPVFAIVLLFTFILHPWIVRALDLTPISIPKATSYLLLFPNYFSELTKEQYIYLAIVWTIYMFIQFYVFWGLILKFFIQKIKYIGAFMIVIGVASRVFYILNEKTYEFDTLSAGIPIGFGAIVADIIRNNERAVNLFKEIPKGSIALIYLFGIGILSTGYLFLGGTFSGPLVPLLTCTFFGFVVLEQTYGKNSVFKFRKSKVLMRLGKISYGLIVYQSIIMVLGIISIESLNLGTTSVGVQIGFLLLSFFLSWIAADVSYNIYERPFLSVRKEFKRS